MKTNKQETLSPSSPFSNSFKKKEIKPQQLLDAKNSKCRDQIKFLRHQKVFLQAY